MRTRNILLRFFVNEAEYRQLSARVAKSGLSYSAYLRQFIKGLIPKDIPPPDYFSMMRELYAIGNNLNQIARAANMTGMIDDGKYDEAVKETLINSGVRICRGYCRNS